MFGKKKKEIPSDFDLSDDGLGKALGKLEWQYYGERNLESVANPPKILMGLMRAIQSLDHDGYLYYLDRNGYLMRHSPKILPTVENISEKVQYFVDGVGVTLREIQERLKKKEEAARQ